MTVAPEPDSAVIDWPALGAGSVLRLGNAPFPPGFPAGTIVDAAEAATVQLSQRFDIVVVSPAALHGDDGARRAVVHNAVQHIAPQGHLAMLHSDADRPHLPESHVADLALVARQPVGELLCSLYRRGDRFTVHDLVFEARAGLCRLHAKELAGLLAGPTPPLVLDTRTPSDRARIGTITGAIHLPRTVLEWRVDPSNGYLHPAITGFEQHLVVVCNHGYSSSVAAANLQRLGFTTACDLIGGMAAWSACGLPLVPPDHTFLEL